MAPMHGRFCIGYRHSRRRGLSLSWFGGKPDGMSASLSDMSGKYFSDGNFWLVGCGTMGGSLLSCWLEAGLDAKAVTVIDPSPSGLPAGFAGKVFPTFSEALDGGRMPDLLVLGIKPQTLGKVTEELQRAGASRPLVVSMLAGVRTTTLQEFLPDAPLVRIMPNTPARVGKGVTAAYAVDVDEPQKTIVESLLQAAGSIFWLDEEAKFDVVTAVSGCGPAFLFRFIETLAGAGEALGLEPEMAQDLALHTVIGSTALVEQSALSPAELRRQVTSPNGVTEAGLDVLDGKGELSRLVRTTLRAASERSRELALAAEKILLEDD